MLSGLHGSKSLAINIQSYKWMVKINQVQRVVAPTTFYLCKHGEPNAELLSFLFPSHFVRTAAFSTPRGSACHV